MILKNILFKNFILKTIKNKYDIVNIILLLRQIVILYIVSYTQAVFNKQWVAINNLSSLYINLKIWNFFTNMPYINNNKITYLFDNGKILQKQLFLLKWVIYLIYLINKNKIKLPFNNLIKLFKKFVLLKKNYWSIINLNNPTYILFISKEFNSNIFTKYITYNKQVFFITSTYYYNSSVIVSPNLTCFKVILELLIISHIQGKYFYEQKIFK